MPKPFPVALAFLLVAVLPASESLAQSGARSFSPPGSGSRPSTQPGGGFTQTQNNQIRASSTIRNNTVSAINQADLSRGDARTEVRNSFAGLSNRVSPPSRPPRATAASFGSVGSRPAAKPFSNVTRGPNVTPFLGLFTETFDGDTVNFNQFVQPQLQQQNITQQLQRQQEASQRLQQQQSQAQIATNLRLQQLAARPTFNPSGSQRTPPTGHPTAFGNTLRYYGGR